jgi:hypothetical protein
MHRATRIGLALVAGAAATLASTGVAAAGNGTGITAVPAGSGTWGNCSGTFVRSASGIVNETNRVCGTGDSEDIATYGAPVYVQFRPQGGTPNAACDPAGLIRVIVYPGSSDQSTLGKWFIPTTTYNACFYYVNPQLASGTVDSASQSGVTQSFAVPGRYRVAVSGTWNNTSHGLVDAEFDNGDHASDWSDAAFTQDGWPGLGADWGDLLVNGAGVNWGSYNAGHNYSTDTAAGTSSITLNVFDGDATSGYSYNPGWYGDNVGSLSYTVTYLGQ